MLASLALEAQGIPLCKEDSFKAGESITMGIMYKWGAVNTEVAQAILALEEVPYGPDSTQVYHSECKIKSSSFFDVFYKMREHFQSWFTIEENRPLEACRDTYENGYSAINHYVYDWEAGVIRADVAYNGQPTERKNLPIEGMSYDIVSLIYYLRSLEWKESQVGVPVKVPFAVDDTVFQVQITYRGQETLKVRRKGRFKALRFSCTVVAGALFAGNQELQVWFSDDANHLPLAVMVPLRMGTMWAWLKSWDGLNNPIESRL